MIKEYRVARNFCRSLFLRIREFLCFARSNFCDQDRLVFLSGNYFLRFSKSTQYPALIIFSFLLRTCNRNTYFQVVIEQTQFLSTVFLYSEFKLENLLWSKFLWEKCLWQFLFAGIYFCRSLEKAQKSLKLEPAKILCQTVELLMVKCQSNNPKADKCRNCWARRVGRSRCFTWLRPLYRKNQVCAV